MYWRGKSMYRKKSQNVTNLTSLTILRKILNLNNKLKSLRLQQSLPREYKEEVNKQPSLSVCGNR